MLVILTAYFELFQVYTTLHQGSKEKKKKMNIF